MKELKIKKTGLDGVYEVINHGWDESNGRLEIYRSTCLGGYTYWRSSYSSSFYKTLREAKASTFAMLEADGLGKTEITIALESMREAS